MMVFKDKGPAKDDCPYVIINRRIQHHPITRGNKLVYFEGVELVDGEFRVRYGKSASAKDFRWKWERMTEAEIGLIVLGST